jgi:hypothetical protein
MLAAEECKGLICSSNTGSSFAFADPDADQGSFAAVPLMHTQMRRGPTRPSSWSATARSGLSGSATGIRLYLPGRR